MSRKTEKVVCRTSRRDFIVGYLPLHPGVSFDSTQDLVRQIQKKFAVRVRRRTFERALALLRLGRDRALFGTGNQGTEAGITLERL